MAPAEAHTSLSLSAGQAPPRQAGDVGRGCRPLGRRASGHRRGATVEDQAVLGPSRQQLVTCRDLRLLSPGGVGFWSSRQSSYFRGSLAFSKVHKFTGWWSLSRGVAARGPRGLSGRGSGYRSLHFPPSGEATSRRSWSPLAAPQGAGALDTPLGPALPPTPAPPAALGFPLLTHEVGRILSAPSRGHARSREGRRKLGKGLWACCGPGAGSPHVTPNDQLLWPTREAGWVVTETKGRPPRPMP